MGIRLLHCLRLRGNGLQQSIERPASLFGLEHDREKPLRATPCFRDYLSEHRGPDLTRVDIEVLRCKLMGVQRGDYTTKPKGFVFDEGSMRSFGFSWAQEWEDGIAAARGRDGVARRNQHIRTLLRYGLSDWT